MWRLIKFTFVCKYCKIKLFILLTSWIFNFLNHIIHCIWATSKIFLSKFLWFIFLLFHKLKCFVDFFIILFLPRDAKFQLLSFVSPIVVHGGVDVHQINVNFTTWYSCPVYKVVNAFSHFATFSNFWFKCLIILCLHHQ